MFKPIGQTNWANFCGFLRKAELLFVFFVLIMTIAQLKDILINTSFKMSAFKNYQNWEHHISNYIGYVGLGMWRQTLLILVSVSILLLSNLSEIGSKRALNMAEN